MGCAPLVKPRLVASDRAAIMASITMHRTGFLNPTYIFDRILYARLDRKGNPDPNRLLVADVSSKHYVYLLDIPPGSYVPVGAGYAFMGARYWTRFHADEIAPWKIKVAPGEIGFLGGNRLQPIGEVEIGKMLGHLLRRLAVLFPPWRRAVIRFEAAPLDPDRSAEAEIRAMRETITALAGTPWASIAERRLRQLGNPPRPLFTGWLFRRPVIPVKSRYFSYDDLLGWGHPYRVRGGLEWRSPRDRARIAVRYIADGSGGQPLGDYLRDLAAAGSPEDAHFAAKTLLLGQDAYRVRYTTYAYPRQLLLGAKTRVFITKAVVVPKKGGYYVLHLRALKRYFPESERLFDRFIRHLDLAVPRKESPR
jgi:hypothetical protein